MDSAFERAAKHLQGVLANLSSDELVQFHWILYCWGLVFKAGIV